MSSELIEYVKNGRDRIRTGEVDGSHALGVFTKAAKGFESELRSYLRSVSAKCGLDYAGDIRPRINGPSDLRKLTLGQMCAAFEAVLESKPRQFKPILPVPMTTLTFVNTLRHVNEIWVKAKHEDAKVAEFESGLQKIQEMLVALDGSRRGR